MNGKKRLERDLKEFLTSSQTPTTTYRPNTTYTTKGSWGGKENKTIFFYHWSSMCKGYDVCHGLSDFVKKMESYDIPVGEYQKIFVKSVDSQLVYVTCKPQKKDLIFRTTYCELRDALQTYTEGKLV